MENRTGTFYVPYLGPTADKADGSQTRGVERDPVGQQKHVLVGSPRTYVGNICTYVHQGRLRTGGTAAENNFSLPLRLPTQLQLPPTA